MFRFNDSHEEIIDANAAMILVTGARNFVGIEVARQLAALSYPLRVMVGDTAEARLFDDFRNVEVMRIQSQGRLAADALSSA